MSTGTERLADRVILVTGTASGIGLATVAALVDAGARVHAADFRAPLAEERLGAQRLETGRLTVHQLDVTDPEAVEETVGRIGAKTHAAAGPGIIITEPVPFLDGAALGEPAFRRIWRQRPGVIIRCLRDSATGD